MQWCKVKLKKEQIRINRIVPIWRWHDHLCRKSEGLYKKAKRTNKYVQTVANWNKKIHFQYPKNMKYLRMYLTRCVISVHSKLKHYWDKLKT